jgi:hypothetical protein
VSDRVSLLPEERSQNYSYGTSISVRKLHSLQLGSFRSVQLNNGSPIGRFVLDQFSASVPSIENYSAYAYYSNIRLGSQAVKNLNMIVLADYGHYGRFGFHDQLQFGTLHRYGADWTLQLAKRDAFLRAGLDRSTYLNQEPGFAPVVGIHLALPGGQSLRLSFVSERHTKMLQFELGGRLNPDRKLARDSSSRPVAVVATRLTGRVYLDSDFNGAFDLKTDKAIADEPVWLDDEKVVHTDTQGVFRFDQVSTGAHKLRAALESVPADLVFADISERTIAIAPYGQNVMNFRVVRAGRITGKVTYLDYSAGPDNPIERPLPDVRIVSTGDRDTFSESNGSFLMSDLPPGSYELKVDPGSIPEHYVSNPVAVRVQITPGVTPDEVRFQLIPQSRPVIERELSGL